jgi:hypothetical protein
MMKIIHNQKGEIKIPERCGMTLSWLKFRFMGLLLECPIIVRISTSRKEFTTFTHQDSL